MPKLSDRTRLVAGATRRGLGRRPVNPPIERASTMLSDDPAAMQDPRDGPVYGLDGTSAARELRAALADLEGASEVFLVPRPAWRPSPCLSQPFFAPATKC
ncbi:hypothetical protein RSD66_08220 [Brevundimonas sp. S1H14]